MDYTKQAFATKVSSVDQGLRAYMVAVYNYMAVALAITGGVAFAVSSSPTLIQLLFGTPLQWLVMFAPLIMVFFAVPKIATLSLQGAQTVFWVFAAVMGVSLASIFLVYTGESITRVFFICAAMFGSVSLYGYTTKKDLTGLGTFMFMGLIGLIIASVVNIFLQSPMMYFIVSFIGVIIFTGLTAYDTQRIKDSYYHFSGSAEMAGKGAIYGALSLYMDFINLFISLLRLFGDRR
ncbi:MAG: Bax inhibitor-1 family protein [Rickettsiales bacterium]